MFDQSPLGAGMVSLDHRFLMVNGALCHILRYSAEDFAGHRSDRRALPPR